ASCALSGAMCAKRGSSAGVCGGARAAAPNAISASILRFVLHPTSSVAPLKPLASRTDALRQSDIRAVTFAVNRVGGINQSEEHTARVPVLSRCTTPRPPHPIPIPTHPHSPPHLPTRPPHGARPLQRHPSPLFTYRLSPYRDPRWL